MRTPLMLISGVVTDLSVQRGEEEFVRSAGQQEAGVAAAAGLAATGLAGAGIGASLAAVSAGDSVEFFSCKVGGKKIEGRFSKISFKEGEELDFVVEPEVTPLALAARRPSDFTVWMVPHCSRSAKAHALFALRMSLWLFVSFTLLLGSFAGILDWRSNSSFEPSFTLFWISLTVANTLVMSLYFSIRFYRQWLPIAHQAEAIFVALGYPDPSRVDLPRDHKRYCQTHGIKWPYATDGPWIYRYLDPDR